MIGKAGNRKKPVLLRTVLQLSRNESSQQYKIEEKQNVHLYLPSLLNGWILNSDLLQDKEEFVKFPGKSEDYIDSTRSF